MKADVDKVVSDINSGALTGTHKYADISWLLVSAAFVMLMLPGLALFYGGMARRKNVLATMMQTMAALGLVGVQWVVIGYALAFGKPAVEVTFPGTETPGGVVGYSPELVMLPWQAAVPVAEADVAKETGLSGDALKEEVAKRNRFNSFPNTNLPLYLHAMFQGMFAIITVALISGAFAERVKFGPYLLFALLWTTAVYDPLAHMVWSYQWATDAQKVVVPLSNPEVKVAPAAGLLGVNGAIDFAGGTVVHIAAGFSGLAAVLLLRKRLGYGEQAYHPNSMVLTLLGAGLLWFGWFGFNGGSALFANGQAVSAFAVTQIAAAAAGMAWLLTEWCLKGKPTALGFASGVVAGLVAITPASGFVAPGGALVIGLVAGVLCYAAVLAKGALGYDDSLDAFGVHGVGGLIGAVLTGAFVALPLWAYGAEMPPGAFPGKTEVVGPDGARTVEFVRSSQILWQVKASLVSAVYAFLATGVLVLLIDKTVGFTVPPREEADGLDLTQHGEVGFDYGGAHDETAGLPVPEPKAAAVPPNGPLSKRFTVVVEGADPATLLKVWSDLCQPRPDDEPPGPAFSAVYPYFTTVTGNKFRFRGGNPVALREELQKVLSAALGAPVRAHVES
ncbi:MAG: ammonium transporter [Gemmataceae bacterium]|nr:ammonium transporter [Gemmataceae bacterium]